MTGLLIAGIVGMIACFIVGWYGGRKHEHEAAMDAAQMAILADRQELIGKLKKTGAPNGTTTRD